MCLFDRFQRTNAWEQRHEQILNDANQTLAHAGDLAHAVDLPKPADPNGVLKVNANSGRDKCEEAFSVGQAPRASAELR